MAGRGQAIPKTTRNVIGLPAGVVLVGQGDGAAWAELEEGVAVHEG